VRWQQVKPGLICGYRGAAGGDGSPLVVACGDAIQMDLVWGSHSPDDVEVSKELVHSLA
jgi:hypothetical protein